MMNTSRSRFLAVLGLLASACAVGDASVVSTDASIVNGKVATAGAFPAVLRIDTAHTSCTGTRVGPTQILSARHCFKALLPGSSVSISDGPTGAVSSLAATVQRVDLAPSDPQGVTRDVLVLTLAAPLPDTVPIWSVDPEVVRAERLLMVGYGCSSFQDDDEGQGVLRYGENEPFEFLPTEFHFWPHGTAGCPGDSGGPALRYRGVTPYVVGTAYWVYMGGKNQGLTAYATLHDLGPWLTGLGVSVRSSGSSDSTTAAMGKVVALGGGQSHMCAINTEGRVKCWGPRGDVLGTGDPFERGTDPSRMGDALPFINVGSRGKAVDVGGGSAHTCVLFESGRITCWGFGQFGELGTGKAEHHMGDTPWNMGDALTDVALPSGRKAVALYTSGARDTCAKLDNGEVACWGENYFGRFGLGDRKQRNVPTVGLLQSVKKIEKVSLGGIRTLCALRVDGSVDCWGNQTYWNGGLGLGYGNEESYGDKPEDLTSGPRAIDLGGRKAVDIHVGTAHACVLTSGNEVLCWGRNTDNLLGTGDVSANDAIGDEPGEMGAALRPVKLGTDKRIVGFVGNGAFHTCVRFVDQTIGCWGRGAEGQLANGSSATSGVAIANLGTQGGVVAAGGTDRYTCAALSNGKVKCWGHIDRANTNGTSVSEDIGNDPSEIGDQMPYVNLGMVGQ